MTQVNQINFFQAFASIRNINIGIIIKVILHK